MLRRLSKLVHVVILMIWRIGLGLELRVVVVLKAIAFSLCGQQKQRGVAFIGNERKLLSKSDEE